ncbi:MAG TPA: hypothetical protein VHU23_14285 [Rhizomicrobium sp.]|nr:hypothetical protein [Rhizomicrobium sp.]
MTDLNPDTLLTRARSAEALTCAGYPTSKASLATLACRGGGPVYRLYSRTALYRWSDLLAWAEARCSAPRKSTSELDAMDRTAGVTTGI